MLKNSRRLSTTTPKLKWYEKKWAKFRDDIPIGKRHLFTSYGFTIYTTSEKYDWVLSFATEVLSCTYFCIPAEFGNEEIPLNELSNLVSFGNSNSNFRKLSSGSGYTYLGCVADVRNNRVLSQQHVTSSNNGPAACAQTCEGYEYFGLQWGIECWCGNPTNYKQNGELSESSCDMDCTDNSGLQCGGLDTMSMYKYGTSSTILPYTYLSCVNDNRSNRLMAVKITNTNDNGLEKCSEQCAGYIYFGLQYGVECWCGNDNDYDQYGALSDSSCDMSCSDGSNVQCGGTDKLSVYKYVDATTYTSYSYQPCVVDATADRVFSIQYDLTNNNGPEICSSLCAGYTYFGLQNGEECHCGSSENYQKHGVVSDSECDMDCADGSGNGCGGHNRMAIYKYDDNLQQHITLPRPCVLVHGPGVDTDSIADFAANTQAAVVAGSSNGLFLAQSLHTYFGYVEQALPCYCSTMSFVVTNTMEEDWYHTDLQIKVCRSIALESNPINSVTTSSNSAKALSITNTVVITHHTASLTLGAAISEGYCSFDTSSKWATIHTPVGISFDDAITETSSNGISILLCNQDNMQAYIDALQQYSSTRRRRQPSLSDLLAQQLPGGASIQDVFDACSSTGSDATVTSLQEFANNVNANKFPEDVQTLYEAAQNQMALRVSAALCGYGSFGLLSTKALINEIAAALRGASEDELSDGVTLLENCLKIADMQQDGVQFTTDPSSSHYVSASQYSDVSEFRDSWVGDAANMREWVDKLRMHVDL